MSKIYKNPLLLILAGLSLTVFSSLISAETIKVGFEPFPPFIIDKDTGYTIKLLKEVEAISDLKFEIIIMSYARAKRWLGTGEVDIIGHTPYQVETDAFYKFAQELNFTITTVSDLYSMNRSNFNDP